jgi:hypothetical protein
MAEERDFIMARLAAARGHLAVAADALDGCLGLFLFPVDDKDGAERNEALDIISESAGEVSRSVEAAQTLFDGLDKKQLVEEEPELPEGDEFDENPVTDDSSGD